MSIHNAETLDPRLTDLCRSRATEDCLYMVRSKQKGNQEIGSMCTQNHFWAGEVLATTYMSKQPVRIAQEMWVLRRCPEFHPKIVVEGGKQRRLIIRFTRLLR